MRINMAMDALRADSNTQRELRGLEAG